MHKLATYAAAATLSLSSLAHAERIHFRGNTAHAVVSRGDACTMMLASFSAVEQTTREDGKAERLDVASAIVVIEDRCAGTFTTGAASVAGAGRVERLASAALALEIPLETFTCGAEGCGPPVRSTATLAARFTGTGDVEQGRTTETVHTSAGKISTRWKGSTRAADVTAQLVLDGVDLFADQPVHGSLTVSSGGTVTIEP